MQPTRPFTANISDFANKRWTEDLWNMFHRKISFGRTVNGKDQNIDGQMLEINDTGLAGTVNTLIHNLGRVPLYIDLKYKNVTGDWQDSGTPWTNTKAFVTFTTDHMHVRLFVH